MKKEQATTFGETNTPIEISDPAKDGENHYFQSGDAVSRNDEKRDEHVYHVLEESCNIRVSHDSIHEEEREHLYYVLGDPTEVVEHDS